jgi:hypothetical protein
MTHVVKLFGDSIVAEQTEKGTYKVKSDGQQLSPYEYHSFWLLTPKSYALKRQGQRRIDILFRNGRMFFSADHAYDIGSLGPDNGNAHLIAVVGMYGTLVMDDWMDVRLFVSGYPRIDLVEEKFLVVYIPNEPGARVRVYNLRGEFLSEGEFWSAVDDARINTGEY